MLLSSHTFSFIAYSLRQGHRFKDNSIPPLPYPKALARNNLLSLTHRPYDIASLSHSSYLYKVSLTAPQPSVPFSYHLRRKGEKPNVVTLTNRYSLRNLARFLRTYLICDRILSRISFLHFFN